jgi:hypothetical protein
MRIRRSLLVALATAIILAMPAVAHAASVYVSVLGSDTAGDGSVGSPYATIPHALSLASWGDNVHVSAGTFNGDVALKDGVSLYGAGSAATTLHGTGTSSVIYAASVGANTTISGFTITGGSSQYGGGICCTSASSPNIINNTIAGNTAIHGGAICCGGNSTPKIINNVITGNTAATGGGICCENGPDIYAPMADIINDTIVGNTAASGGGICCMDPYSAPKVVNCIVWDNGDDLAGCYGTYSDVKNPAMSAGTGNISAPPSFAGTATGDFHLNPGSPCIDAGTSRGAPATDKDGATRPRVRGYDMGAYEYIPPTHTITPAAGSGGSISPNTPQTVDEGTDKAFFVSAGTGYHILGVWMDDQFVVANASATTASPTFLNVTDDHSITASFAINTYALRYTAGTGGTLKGVASQIVNYMQNGTAVTAVPKLGYRFLSWSDAVPTATRSETGVTANVSATANFALNPVRSTVTRLSGPTSVKVKNTLKLTGTVTPPGPGTVTITMTRLVGKVWKSAGTPKKVTVVAGKFSYSFKPASKGTWHFVAAYSGGYTSLVTYKASKSTTKSVVVK